MTEFTRKTMVKETGGITPEQCTKAWPGSGRKAGYCVKCNDRLCTVCGGVDSDACNMCWTGHAPRTVQL